MKQSNLMKEINTRLDALNNWLNSEQDDVIREILEQSLQEPAEECKHERKIWDAIVRDAIVRNDKVDKPAEKKISKIEQLNNLNEYFKKVIKILEE